LCFFSQIIPVVFLGAAKVPLAKELHEKNLYADAETAKADWMSAIGGNSRDSRNRTRLVVGRLYCRSFYFSYNNSWRLF
jgi:hypothetical protein